MIKISTGSTKLLTLALVSIPSIVALFMGYLWLTRRSQVYPNGSPMYDAATLTSYVALAVCCAALVVFMLFVRKSPKLLNFFTR